MALAAEPHQGLIMTDVAIAAFFAGVIFGGVLGFNATYGVQCILLQNKLKDALYKYGKE